MIAKGVGSGVKAGYQQHRGHFTLLQRQASKHHRTSKIVIILSYYFTRAHIIAIIMKDELPLAVVAAVGHVVVVVVVVATVGVSVCVGARARVLACVVDGVGVFVSDVGNDVCCSCCGCRCYCC